MADVVALHRRACQGFATTVTAIRPAQWNAPTPCVDWTVRELVAHVVGEDLWTVPLMGGATMAQIGDRFDGDVLGAHPVEACQTATNQAVAAVSEPGALERTVHLSFGDVDGAEYAWQLFTDHLVHTWDLTRALGLPDRLDADLVHACAAWFAEREDLYRSGGAIGPRAQVADDADAQTRLLATFGRSPHWTPPDGPDRPVPG